MFVTRLITAAVALPIFAAALLLLSQQLWALILLPGLGIASWEWGSLAGYSRIVRIVYSGIILISASTLIFFMPHLAHTSEEADLIVYALSFAFWIAGASLWLKMRWTTRNGLLLGAAGWIALVPLWLALVRLQPTPWALLLCMSIVWIADTTAYLAGKRWGRRKLAPAISPGKTWEGALAAVAAVAIYYAILSVLVPAGESYFSGWWGLGLFVAVLVLSIEGDLFESWMKRQAKVKDSGQLLPGHGGILDRIDGLTAALPFAALALLLR